MSALVLDGKSLATETEAELLARVERLKVKSGGKTPILATILVGDDPASQVYVRNKERACAKCGLKSTLHRLPTDTTQQQLADLVSQLNNDDTVHGILVQLPLPKQIDPQAVLAKIDPAKDVDGFHVQNAGRVVQEDPDGFVSCTPAGIIEICQREGISLEGKHVVVIGRSLIATSVKSITWADEVEAQDEQVESEAGGDATVVAPVTTRSDRTQDSDTSQPVHH